MHSENLVVFWYSTLDARLLVFTMSQSMQQLLQEECVLKETIQSRKRHDHKFPAYEL